ncbi:MAG: hypothetical protein Q4D94_05395 [Bacillota bacterium]|nr:hypothetical protein [Bacillota bacterium]
MLNTDFGELLYTHLEERSFNNVFDHLCTDKNYQKALSIEHQFLDQYNALDLTIEQRAVIDEWVSSIQATNAAYSMVVFRLGMQNSFLLMKELIGL